MSARKPPLLLRGGLTGRVYVVTAYTDLGDGRIEARTKHDVTDQYDALVRAASACCHLHKPDCCDPDDCGPCCENCQTCPTLTRVRAAGGAS